TENQLLSQPPHPGPQGLPLESPVSFQTLTEPEHSLLLQALTLSKPAFDPLLRLLHSRPVSVLLRPGPSARIASDPHIPAPLLFSAAPDPPSCKKRSDTGLLESNCML